ncbi:MAG: hypothetical protein HC869_03475 [Rhodospirillales bacterium]|nr:hypothetical protein [Rhodospirillales bacterium]
MKQFWEIYAADVEKSAQFYTEAVGLEVTRQHVDFVVVQCGAVKLHICSIADLPLPLQNGSQNGSLGSRTEFCFEVDDIQEAYSRAQSSRFEILESLQEQLWGKTDFRMIDPDGAYIRITTPRLGENVYEKDALFLKT